MQNKQSKMIKIYKNTKQQHEKSIVLCKSGRFYLSFYGDALILNKELGYKINPYYSWKDCPFCGFPINILENVIEKLTSIGYEFAVWTKSEDEKQDVLNIYKTKLNNIKEAGQIECKWDFIEEDKETYIPQSISNSNMYEQLIEHIKDIDMNNITPIDAVMSLYKLKQMVK